MKQSQALMDLYRKKRNELSEEMYLVDLVLEHGAVISDYGEIQTENYDLYKEIQEHYRTWDYWQDVSNFTLKDLYPKRWQKTWSMMRNQFISHLEKEYVLFDIACGNGEWTEIVSEYVGHIDGYEYSQKMVELAREEAEKKQIKNITYVQADATTLQLKQSYDAGMCLGLFTCLEEEEAKLAIRNIALGMKKGGYLVTRDSLTLSGEDCLYHFNHTNGYQAIYRSIETYYQLFTDAGFTLVYETNLDVNRLTIRTENLKAVSRGTIWKMGDII